MWCRLVSRAPRVTTMGTSSLFPPTHRLQQSPHGDHRWYYRCPGCPVVVQRRSYFYGGRHCQSPYLATASNPMKYDVFIDGCRGTYPLSEIYKILDAAEMLLCLQRNAPMIGEEIPAAIRPGSILHDHTADAGSCICFQTTSKLFSFTTRRNKKHLGDRLHFTSMHSISS